MGLIIKGSSSPQNVGTSLTQIESHEAWQQKGSAMQICVGCHGPAGSDAAHTPTAGGRDLVYTPVH